MSAADHFRTGINKILNTLGSVMTLRKPSGDERDVLSVFTSIGQSDGQLINALGIEGKLIYCLPLTPPPQKFDRFVMPGGRAYVIHDAHDVIVEGVLVAHKCAVKAT